MEVLKLKSDLKIIVDSFVAKGSLNPWDLTELVMELVLVGIKEYRLVTGLKGSEKKAFVSEAVNAALKPLLDKDIEQIPDWIEGPAEDMLVQIYIPKYIDKFFETVDNK